MVCLHPEHEVGTLLLSSCLIVLACLLVHRFLGHRAKKVELVVVRAQSKMLLGLSAYRCTIFRSKQIVEQTECFAEGYVFKPVWKEFSSGCSIG